MRRRRKRPEGDRRPAHQQAPPLQPMYPEFSGPGQTVPEPALAPEPVPEPVNVAPAELAPPAAASAEERKSRRRRGRKRGGRGRKRGGAPAQVPAAEVHAAEPQTTEPEPAQAVRAEQVDQQPAPAPPEPAPLPPPVPSPVIQPTPAKGVVVLAIGLPGSGKSSWFRRRGVTPLSSDLLRTLLFDDTTEQRYQDLVFSTLRSLLRARLIARMPWNYVDATNLSPKERRGWIKMAHDFGYEVHAVFFDVPLEVCQQRNLRRQRIVPADVMQRMAQKLRAPTFEEGFSKVTVVRVKPKEEPAD